MGPESPADTPTPALAKAAVLRRRVAGTPTWIPTSGVSMGRAVASGDSVLVVGTATPRRGEIWAFVDSDANLVVHRFRSRRDGLWWFRGDGNSADDRPVTASAVVGRVIQIERGSSRRKLGERSRFLGHVRLDLWTVRRWSSRFLEWLRRR
jgi:hypothetical protein